MTQGAYIQKLTQHRIQNQHQANWPPCWLDFGPGVTSPLPFCKLLQRQPGKMAWSMRRLRNLSNLVEEASIQGTCSEILGVCGENSAMFFVLHSDLEFLSNQFRLNHPSSNSPFALCKADWGMVFLDLKHTKHVGTDRLLLGSVLSWLVHHYLKRIVSQNLEMLWSYMQTWRKDLACQDEAAQSANVQLPQKARFQGWVGGSKSNAQGFPIPKAPREGCRDKVYAEASGSCFATLLRPECLPRATSSQWSRPWSSLTLLMTWLTR